MNEKIDFVAELRKRLLHAIETQEEKLADYEKANIENQWEKGVKDGLLLAMYIVDVMTIGEDENE